MDIICVIHGTTTVTFQGIQQTLLYKATYKLFHILTLMACKVPAAHQELFGVQYLAQGCFNMQLGGAGIQTSNLPITRQFALPPELQPQFKRDQQIIYSSFMYVKYHVVLCQTTLLTTSCCSTHVINNNQASSSAHKKVMKITINWHIDNCCNVKEQLSVL